jgi:hypothetical protein
VTSTRPSSSPASTSASPHVLAQPSSSPSSKAVLSSGSSSSPSSLPSTGPSSSPSASPHVVARLSSSPSSKPSSRSGPSSSPSSAPSTGPPSSPSASPSVSAQPSWSPLSFLRVPRLSLLPDLRARLLRDGTSKNVSLSNGRNYIFFCQCVEQLGSWALPAHVLRPQLGGGSGFSGLDLSHNTFLELGIALSRCHSELGVSPCTSQRLSTPQGCSFCLMT